MGVRGTIAFRSLSGEAVDPACLPEHLDAFGVAVFSEATRESLGASLASWTVRVDHPHAGRGGFTVLRPRLRPGPGRAGFSRAEVGLHTDRAQVEDPPSVVAVLVERPAAAGGESHLMDCAGDEAFIALARDPTCETFLRDHDGNRRPVVERRGGRLRVRYRDDALAHPGAIGGPGNALAARLRTLIETPLILPLDAGSGYLLHNHRVLHGRAAFTGRRRAVRLLADLPGGHRLERLNDGFTV